MPPDPASLVADIRSASRELVREFGFMTRTVAGADLSLSAVHAIIEIGRASRLSAKALSERLLLEKSTVSRLVSSLVARGEIREVRAPHDARMKYLHLTARGRSTLRAIDSHADAQVTGALARLDERARRRVLNGLQAYAAALQGTADTSRRIRRADLFKITSGYAPGISGRIIELLLPHMHKHYGFGKSFEVRLANDLADFMTRLGSPTNEIWRAENDRRIVGSISIDGEDLGDDLAHVRWFVVADENRGGGIGRALLARALAFCDDRGFREVHLWTVKGLDTARKLYERHDFQLVDEYKGDQWGKTAVEQKFVRARRT